MKCRNKYKKMHLLGQSRKNPLVQVKQLGIKKITGKNRWYAHPIIEVSAKCRLETAYAKWWTNVGTYQRLLKQSMKGKCCLAAIVGERKEDVPQFIEGIMGKDQRVDELLTQMTPESERKIWVLP